MSKKESDIAVLGTTCFSEHEKYGVACKKKECRYWQKIDGCQNCTIISSNQGPKTLQEIGDIFSVTRMRICQLEKIILKKLLSKSDLGQEL
jgi:hypothetical protein